jgi:hypothetical protein
MKTNGLLDAQQSANFCPSHVEYDDVKVHDVVEVVPRAAMRTLFGLEKLNAEKRVYYIPIPQNLCGLLTHGSHILPGGSFLMVGRAAAGRDLHFSQNHMYFVPLIRIFDTRPTDPPRAARRKF